MIKDHVKFIVSSKVTLLEERVEKELEALRSAGFYIDLVSSNISYAGDKGYMILVQIEYHEDIFTASEINVEEKVDG